MGKPRAPTPTSRPLKGRNGNKPFENKIKLGAILRVHGGESKAAVARAISVPESTLRGWCKNEQKIRNQVQQENIHSEASNSSVDSNSNLAEPSLLQSAAVGSANFSNAPQPFSSTPPKTPGLYTPLELDILKDPKTPQNLPIRAEIPRSNGRNKAELHRIGMGMPTMPAYDGTFKYDRTTYPSPRLLQEHQAASTSKKSSQAQVAAAAASAEIANNITVMQMFMLLQQQQYQNQQNASIQQLQPKIPQRSENIFSANGLPATSSRPSSSTGNKRMSVPSTSLSSSLNGALDPTKIHETLKMLSTPFPLGASSSSANDDDLLQKALAYHQFVSTKNTGAALVSPGQVNGHGRIMAPLLPSAHQGDSYWAKVANMQINPSMPKPNNSQPLPEQNAPLGSPFSGSPQSSPQDLRKSVSPREPGSPTSSLSSRHGSDSSNRGSPSPYNQDDSNRSSSSNRRGFKSRRYLPYDQRSSNHLSPQDQHSSSSSSPNAASPVPYHDSPMLKRSASAEPLTPAPSSISQPATTVAPQKSPLSPNLSQRSGRLEAVLANIIKMKNIAIPKSNDKDENSDELFKTHLGAPTYEIENPEDGLLVGKIFYNFLNKSGPIPGITETFCGQVKQAILAMIKYQNEERTDRSE